MKYFFLYVVLLIAMLTGSVEAANGKCVCDGGTSVNCKLANVACAGVGGYVDNCSNTTATCTNIPTNCQGGDADCATICKGVTCPNSTWTCIAAHQGTCKCGTCNNLDCKSASSSCNFFGGVTSSCSGESVTCGAVPSDVCEEGINDCSNACAQLGCQSSQWTCPN